MKKLQIAYILNLILLILVFGSLDADAQKVQVVQLNKAQVVIDTEKPNEFTAYLVSENGTGGVIVTPVKSPKLGNIKTVYAKERKELSDIGHPGGKKSGIELRFMFEDEIIGLSPEAWVTFNIFQSGATEICTYSMESIFCE